jgi:predicted nucleic-acid-binding Zn-ribbon protein
VDETQRDESLQQKPCHICGSTDFQWGTPHVSGSYALKFMQDLPGFLDVRLVGFVIRECSHCGNAQWFTREKE